MILGFIGSAAWSVWVGLRLSFGWRLRFKHTSSRTSARPAGQEPINWLHYIPGYEPCRNLQKDEEHFASGVLGVWI